MKPQVPRLFAGSVIALCLSSAGAAQQADVRQAQIHFDKAEELSKNQSAPARREAITQYRKALDIWESLHDRPHQGLALSRIGQTENSLRDHIAAEQHLLQALPLVQEAGDRHEEADVWYALGKARFFRGLARESLEPYEKALGIREGLSDKSGQADVLHNMAAAWLSFGDSQKAYGLYQQVLSIRRAIGDRTGLGHALYAIGLVHWTWGESQHALDNYEKALEVWRSLKNETGEATVLGSAGVVYASLREYNRALDDDRQALAVWRRLADRGGEGHALNNLGMVYAGLKRFREARDCFDRALRLLEPGNDPRGRAYVLNNLGDLELSQHHAAAALARYQESLELKRKIGDIYGEAYTYRALARAYRLADDAAGSAGLARKAVDLAREIGDRSGESAALVALAQAERALHQPDDARTDIESALRLIETQRAELLRQDLRTDFFAARQDAYALHVNLLMATSPEAALEASERSRARVLLDSLAGIHDQIETAHDPTLARRQRSILQQLNAQTELMQRSSDPGHAGDRAAGRKKLDELLESLEEAQSGDRRAALTEAQPLDVGQIRKELLDEKTTLLEYFLDEDHSYAWHLTATGIQSAAIVGRAPLEMLVQRYRGALTARTETPAGETHEQRSERIRRADQTAAHAAEDLSRLLLGPFAGKLGAGRLLIVADGPLHYVPFGALPSPNGDGPLLAHHEIVYLPSASVMKLLREDRARRRRAGHGLAIIADPVFDRDDPRVHPGACPSSASHTSGQYPRLRFSRTEAETIASLSHAGTTALDLDFAANRGRLIGEAAARYRILHLATHTEIDNEQPLLSRIVLSQVDASGCPRDGLVRLYEIYSLHLNADLVVLSGCRTATGREVRGEGLMGLTRGFLYSGAASVIASQWSVDDSATSEVMRRFYEPLLRKGMKPAAALRSAQASMAADPHWSNPYYWAAFTFQGDWK